MAAHMITAQGRDHYLTGPEIHTNVIALADIAHALSLINRFTGHTKRPYSVAEHSLLCADLARDEGHSAIVQMAALTHDAHEAYTGDMSSPVKVAVGLSWSHFEAMQADHVRRSLGLVTTFAAHRTLLRRLDLIALATERHYLIDYQAGTSQWWMVLDAPGAQVEPARHINLNSLQRINRDWRDWRQAFTDRFNQLAAQIWTDGHIPLATQTA